MIAGEHGVGCEGGGHDGPCPLCRGEASPEFVALIEVAASGPRRVMTVEQFETWLAGIGTDEKDTG